jgi:ribose/xylose/arabinose/galactoside ABC-type transport system permease subunit
MTGNVNFKTFRMPVAPANQDASPLRRALAALGPAIGLTLAYALFATLQFKTFVTWDNLAIMLQQTAIIAAGATGMTVVIIAGGIDLSIGSAVALGTVMIALALKAGWPPLAAALGGVATGAFCGLVTGGFVTRLRLSPFIVTLGLMGALRGAAKGLANEQPIYPDETWLNHLMRLGATGAPPVGVWLTLVMAVLVALMLRYTRFGRHVFAIGSNELTARLCGVPIERQKVLIYVLGGAFAGVASILQFAYLTGGDPTAAGGLELSVIAAVVIGGASLSGGQGSVLGSMLGALIMSVVANGCTKLGLPNWVQEIVTGAIIVAAVWLDRLRSRERE